jgi:cobalt/nickel transport protein
MRRTRKPAVRLNAATPKGVLSGLLRRPCRRVAGVRRARERRDCDPGSQSRPIFQSENAVGATFRLGALLSAFFLAFSLSGPARAEYFAILLANPPLVTHPDAARIKVEIAFGHPFDQVAFDMDPLQMFAAIQYPPDEKGEIRRHELLESLIPGKYLGRAAWTSEIPLAEPGLYQLVLETRPYWEASRGVFIQQFAQALIPALGSERGWNLPVGLKMEIVPLTRPFGAGAPSLFTGRVLHEGKALPNAPIYIEYLNEDKRVAQSPYHRTQTARSDENGVFSFVCPYPGWWGFAARIKGDPLKGPDGLPKDTELSGVLWLRVDPPPQPAAGKKRQ